MIVLEQKLSILKRSMLKIVLILWLLATVCFSTNSQNISRNIQNDSIKTNTYFVITSDQLRTTNLIFAEHKKFSEMIPHLQNENNNLRLINYSWERTDSLKNIQLDYKNQIISRQSTKINIMKKSLIASGTVTGVSIIITVLCILLK